MAKEELVTSPRMQEIFDIINQRCYRGRLKVGKIGFRPLTSLAMIAWYPKKRKLPNIFIHSRLRWSEKLCYQELLHEMVHLGNPRLKHGEKFYRRIISLKRVGSLDGDAW